MIKCEYFTTREDGGVLCKTYSTENYMLLQNETGIKYSEAIDVAKLVDGEYKPKDYTYTETNELIETIVETNE